MFGFFQKKKREVTKLRTHFQEIRTRFEYSFDLECQDNFVTVLCMVVDGGSGDETFDSWHSQLELLQEFERDNWQSLADETLEFAKLAWENASIFGEGLADFQRSGADAIALISLFARVKGIELPEARVVEREINAFIEEKVVGSIRNSVYEAQPMQLKRVIC